MRILALLILLTGLPAMAMFGGGGGDSHDSGGATFPIPLENYQDEHLTGIWEIFVHRVEQSPFNLVAALLFFMAIAHTFMASKFLAKAHEWEHEHKKRINRGEARKGSHHFGAGVFHFLGEVEVVFGIWGIALVIAITAFFDWHTAVDYLAHKVNFTEAMFVIVIMALSSTRPILRLSELMMWRIANLFGGMLGAWWMTILTVGPILGSFITEPAAMTISALLLSQKAYELNPKDSFKYATIGLLFVNISVGGTLTHFAAPPVLMVAGPWDWGLTFMLTNFGWKAIIGIVICNTLYYFIYRDQIETLQKKYAVVRLEIELRSHYLQRDELEAQFDHMEEILSDELGFTDSFDTKCEEIKDELRAQIVETIVGRKIDLQTKEAEALFEKAFNEKFEHFKKLDMSATELFEWAFEKRFAEIKLNEMRKTMPGLLPRGIRPPFVDPDWDRREDHVPIWMMVVHVGFLIWTVANAHYPALFVSGLLFFLGFAEVTRHNQNRLDLKGPLLVGFFLAGLVVHGGVQAWWIAPVLGSLSEVPLMIGATVLTAFNDNAAITYLSTLVPNFTDPLKYAVVAGAVTGGGLTVIANAPNPAGVSILKKHFKDGVSPIGLAKSALIPTIIMGLCFMLL